MIFNFILVIISLFVFLTTPDSTSNITIDSNVKINFSDDLAFKDANFDDSSWDKGSFRIKSVAKEKEHIYKPVWARKTIVIPGNFKDTDIMLLAGGITNGFEIYFNEKARLK